MATTIWQGGAQATAQVDHATPASVAVDDTYTVTINGKDITVTATAATAANVIGLLVTAINASTIPEFQEITASDGTTYLIMTGQSDGKPFTATVSKTGSGTFSNSTNTTPTGPYHFDNAENWDTGTAPVDNDTVIFEESSWDCLYGISVLNLTPAKLIIKQSYTGKIGLPPYSGSGSTGYWEYLDQYLAIGDVADALTIAVTIGEGEGSGSGRIKLNTNTAQTNMLVLNSGQAEGTHPAVIWKGTHVSNVLRVYKGSVGVAIFGGETATLEDMDVGYQTRQDTDSEVILGRGADVDDIQQSGGSLTIGGEAGDAIETLVQTGGTSTINGSDGLDSLTIRGGRCYYNSTGTLGGNPIVSGSGILDFTQDMRAKTVTNPIEVYGNDSQVIDSFVVVSSLVVDYNETTRISNLGRNIRITRGTPA
jgi:hypothetical protein